VREWLLSEKGTQELPDQQEKDISRRTLPGRFRAFDFGEEGRIFLLRLQSHPALSRHPKEPFRFYSLDVTWCSELHSATASSSSSLALLQRPLTHITFSSPNPPFGLPFYLFRAFLRPKKGRLPIETCSRKRHSSSPSSERTDEKRRATPPFSHKTWPRPMRVQ